MRCVICNRADVESGLASITLEQDGRLVIVKNVAARVCPFCGEEYLDEQTAPRHPQAA